MLISCMQQPVSNLILVEDVLILAGNSTSSIVYETRWLLHYFIGNFGDQLAVTLYVV